MEIIIKIDDKTKLTRIQELSDRLIEIKNEFPETITEISRDWRVEKKELLDLWRPT